MQRRVAIGLVAFVALAGALATAGQEADELPPPSLEQMMAKALAQWPQRLTLPEEWTAAVPGAPTGQPPLPDPSFTEPFEIGEALNDPARVEAAVVSLLALMQIGIVPSGTPMQPVTGAQRLRFTEAEVRGLIAMGQVDAAAAATSPDGPPFTFADLHRSLAPLIGGLTVEQLAERYARAYEQNPRWLVPQVLQGQPIEPEMPLLRTQLWLLLADAVAPRRGTAPRAERDSPRIVFASFRAQQAIAHIWGSAPIVPDPRLLATPDARFTDAEWQELITRLPAFAAGIMSLTAPRAHEKHRGSGGNVQVEARLSASPTSMVSSITGRILLTTKSSSSSIAGVPIAWNYANNILQHGTMSVAAWTQTTVGPNGVAQVTFTPKNEVADGRGQLMRDSGRVDAYMSPEDIVVALYNLPPAAHGFSWGQVNVGSADLPIEWHAIETIRVELINEYRVRILSALQRDGVDVAIGTLELAPDGTYRGEVRLLAIPTRTVLPGLNCSHGRFAARQYVDVIGTPITEQDSRGQREGAFYSAVRSSAKFFQWDRGTPANYLRLEFYPKEAPEYVRLDKAGNVIRRTRPRCYDEIGGPIDPSGVRTPNFAPLNAAQWTVEHAGYALAIPAKDEELLYRDLTNAGQFFQSGKTIGGAIQQLAAGSDSKWYISINVVKPAKP